MIVCVCVSVCARACVRACVCVCVHVYGDAVRREGQLTTMQGTARACARRIGEAVAALARGDSSPGGRPTCAALRAVGLLVSQADDAAAVIAAGVLPTLVAAIHVVAPPPPPPAAAAGGVAAAGAAVTADDVGRMSVAALRALLAAAGVDARGAVEKSDLRALALEAVASGRATTAASPLPGLFTPGAFWTEGACLMTAAGWMLHYGGAVAREALVEDAGVRAGLVAYFECHVEDAVTARAGAAYTERMVRGALGRPGNFTTEDTLVKNSEAYAAAAGVECGAHRALAACLRAHAASPAEDARIACFCATSAASVLATGGQRAAVLGAGIPALVVASGRQWLRRHPVTVADTAVALSNFVGMDDDAIGGGPALAAAVPDLVPYLVDVLRAHDPARVGGVPPPQEAGGCLHALDGALVDDRSGGGGGSGRDRARVLAALRSGAVPALVAVMAAHPHAEHVARSGVRVLSKLARGDPVAWLGRGGGEEAVRGLRGRVPRGSECAKALDGLMR